MTLTERAWQLLLSGIQGTHAIKVSDAFKLAKAFEAEAAKHEAPKTDGEVWYAAAWVCMGTTTIGIHDGHFDRSEVETFIERERHPDGVSPYFLVEVRRVK